jgi:DNA-binding NtrC family response regulator
MDGLKLASAIRSRWPPIEIVVTSGHRGVTASELPERSVFIPKPYKMSLLAATLHRLLFGERRASEMTPRRTKAE